ncbi:hypothetical protein OXYTRIMIC_371 [Oxytricha trifallax]|uniref:Uncharacterized protein n=1 Tax=Oxytricha trifallax TaxID=1172189 RepID=A0A073HZD7_9SPIT|nr:hypothetical protein OXYTRIMIC_371 [Oxytricha trifallax]
MRQDFQRKKDTKEVQEMIKTSVQEPGTKEIIQMQPQRQEAKRRRAQRGSRKNQKNQRAKEQRSIRRCNELH